MRLALLDRVPRDATVVDVTVRQRRGDQADEHDDDLIDECEFDAILERASRHAGYSATQRDHLEVRHGETVLRSPLPLEPAAVLSRQAPAVLSRRLLSVERISAGAACDMIVRAYAETELPPWAFPIDVEPTEPPRRVRVLSLRVHERARLQLEASCRCSPSGDEYPSLSSSPEEVRRSVRLSIQLRGRRLGRAPADFGGDENDQDEDEGDDGDLRRTALNTLQVVLLGMPPLVARTSA